MSRVVGVAGGFRLEGACLPGGAWAMREPTTGPPPELLREALARRAVADPLTIDWPGAAWAVLLGFGHGSPSGAILVTAARTPAPGQVALLRTIAEGLDDLDDPDGDRSPAVILPTPPLLTGLRELAAAQRSLTDAVVRGEGLQGISAVLADSLGREVVVWDHAWRVLASSGGPFGPADVDLRAPDQVELEDLPDDPVTRSGRWVLAPIRAGTTTSGAIGVVDLHGRWSDLDAVALAQGIACAALEFHRQVEVAAVELRLWGDLANAVLFDAHRDHVRHQARALGYDLDGPHRLGLLEPGIEAGDAVLLVQRACRAQGLRAIVAAYDGRVAVVFDARHPWQELGLAVRREGRLRDGRLGVSRVWPNVDRPADMVREAEVALTAGALAGGSHVTCFDDLGLLRLLTTANDPDALDRFVTDRIGRLLTHDAERHSKLVETLTAYLDAGAALDAAAEALFIHRSTLKYRLGRIRELLEVDLTDASARFELQLACGIHAVVEALRTPAPA